MQRILFLVAVLTFSALPGHSQENKGPKSARVEVTPHLTEAEAGQQVTFAAAGYDESGNKIDAEPSAWFASPSDLAYNDDQGVVTFGLAREVRVGALRH